MLQAKTKGEKLAILKTIICSHYPQINGCKGEPVQAIEWLNKAGNDISIIVGLELMQEKNMVEFLLSRQKNEKEMLAFDTDLELFENFLDACNELEKQQVTIKVN